MRYRKGLIKNIILQQAPWQTMLDHCERKLAGRYLADEIREPKAFGLLGGAVEGDHLQLRHAIPLLKNARQQNCNKPFMDTTMNRHAIPSETPLDQRGWVAEPAELNAALEYFYQREMSIVGAYHMHRVAWEHDAIRDTPTELDAILGKDSRLFMFIISMVEPDRPLIRAFFEGDIDKEVNIIRQDGGAEA